MKANRIINIWLWVLLCVPCLLASCDHDVHNGTEDGGLSVSLSWADQADLSTPVKDVKLWIFNADGMLVTEKHYGSAEEMASERFQLPEGCYRILAATNLTSPFTIADATGAISSWDNIQIALSSYDNVAANAYYGVANVTIDNKEGTYVVQDPLKSVLAELTIIIEGVPQFLMEVSVCSPHRRMPMATMVCPAHSCVKLRYRAYRHRHQRCSQA